MVNKFIDLPLGLIANAVKHSFQLKADAQKKREQLYSDLIALLQKFNSCFPDYEIRKEVNPFDGFQAVNSQYEALFLEICLELEKKKGEIDVYGSPKVRKIMEEYYEKVRFNLYVAQMNQLDKVSEDELDFDIDSAIETIRKEL